jgi:Carboxypeptidase regulatory-like domain/TonB dependent receptor/TonB-dependent Receptor Plug Domain
MTSAVLAAFAVIALQAVPVDAQTVQGRVTDATALGLPGVVVTAAAAGQPTRETVTDDTGAYRFDGLTPGPITLLFRAVQFATRSRTLDVQAGRTHVVDATLEIALAADVTVIGSRAFRNLADVDDPRRSLVGVARAASEGAVTPAELRVRPVLRAGEVLEAVPGLVVSQHTGEGKANQYYLRGFNLDHGTDFATTVAGLPINLPTHAHGHGYTDTNFLIPELVGGIQFSKGPYDASRGDFTTAGAASVRYLNALDRPIASFGSGEQGWTRALAAASPRVGPGHLLVAAEVARVDGPWSRPDDYRRLNGLARYAVRSPRQAWSVTALAYSGRWNGTDQIPARAVDGGLLGRFDGLDQTTGGATSRTAVVGEWQRSHGRRATSATASVQRYDLDLFSNFTYFLDDPVNGDQFHQADRRWIGALRVTEQGLARGWGRPIEWRIGLEGRHDAIGLVGLYRTVGRRRLSTVREDAVDQTSGAAFASAEVELAPKLRLEAGLRGDLFHFDVAAGVAENSGRETAALVSPKGGLVVGPWRGTELYGNAGFGFHSNDARGATITVDPATGARADRVTPLVRATGGEVGLRTVSVPRTQITLAAWTLALDSEQLFVGDAGTTSAGRPSRRSGLEASVYSRLTPWLLADADVAWTRSRFSDEAPEGQRIPGAVGVVADAGVTVMPRRRLFGALRLRAFGPRALVEDGSRSSRATRLVNARAGLQLRKGLALVADAFNLFDAAGSDIDYFYASRLPGEPEGGVDDRHFHPAVPRTLRVMLATTW